jgi:nicotinamide riboside transporter PnuC
VVGSATGITYILVSWKSTHYTPGYLLSLHSAANLFGWNLTWMMLTLRKNQFPLRAGLKLIIPLHWLFVLSIPLGRVVPAASLVSSALAAALLGLTILAPAPKQKPDFPPLPRHQENLP